MWVTREMLATICSENLKEEVSWKCFKHGRISVKNDLKKYAAVLLTGSIWFRTMCRGALLWNGNIL